MKYGNDIRKQRLPVAKAPIDEYRENPRNYSGGSLGILERYREMIRDLMEDEMTSEEIVRIYEALLTDLTLNSKPMITDLTIIAGDQRAFGEGIAEAICCRIVEVPVDKKLPLLYLLDSIVKNIGYEYIDYFSARLPEVFLEAYRQVDRRQHPALRHLFGTWSKVFPDSVLLKIDVELQHMSDSPRLSHGIHVNPKYVEARRRSEHSILDNDKQRARVSLSPLKSHGELTLPRDDYDIDRSNVLKGRASPNVGSNRWSADRDDLRVEPDYKRRRAGEREDRETNDWWIKHSADRAYLNLDSSSAYNQVNDPRALIDAYGSDRGRDHNANWHDTPKALIHAYGTDRLADRLPVGHIKEKSFSNNNKRAGGSWMNTEEEEYDWEDMNPALADGGRSSNLFPTSLPSQNGSLRTRYEPLILGSKLDSEFRRSDMSKSISVARGTHQDQGVHPRFQSSQSFFSGDGRGQVDRSLRASNTNSFGEDLPPLDYRSESGLQSYQPPASALSGRPTTFDLNNGDGARTGLSEWATPRQKQTGEFFSGNGGDSVRNQGSSYSKLSSSALQYPNQLPGYLSNKQTTQIQAATLPHQFLSSQERHGIHQGPNHLGVRPLHHGYVPQRNIGSASNTIPNLTSDPYFTNNLPSGQVFMGGAPLSASVARPGQPSILQSSGYLQNTASTASGGGTFSGLFSSLMSQGLISLTNQQDSIGVDFNTETLKLRHDSSIKALYTDLPRQCTTCGLRFKDQELHRNHMDWHVTKNRMNKNRKQKASRKWFASASMWLSGTEALGPEAIPGFLPTETVVENQEEEEMAVPADEDQTTCELCGEPFDDFYCHETDEWMYRGAVYLNVNPGSTAGLDRSQLGPIVHAKCRPG